MSYREITMYAAVCDGCGCGVDDCDYSAWTDEGGAREDAVSDHEWFEKTRLERIDPPSPDHLTGYRTVSLRLLCPKCQRCEVCGSENAYSVDDEHLVCEDHEDHVFDKEQG